MTALTEPRDPADFDREPEPEFWRAMLAHNRDRIVADVQAGLTFAERVCTRCGATGKQPCVTAGGRVLRRFHVARG